MWNDEGTRSLNQLQSALEASEARFHNLVNSSPDGILVTDLDGIIQYVNPAGERMFGRDGQRLMGQEFGYPVTSGKAIEVDIISPNKTPSVAEMRVVEIEWEGSPALMSTMRDLSERVKLMNDLKRSNKDLDDFASVVSHDIRAPLRNIGLLANWLKEDHSSELNSDAMEDVNLMVSLTKRMQNMLGDLLSYSRISAYQKMTAEVSLEQVFDDVIELISDDIFESDAEIKHHSLPVVECSAAQMVALFQQLIINAITHCKVRPIVNVRAERQGDSWIISFEDNGVGIDERHWERIFTPFNNLNTKNAHEGTGIGLATCKKIVERHNGKIWLHSEAGRGSTFHVQLLERLDS